MSDTTIERVHQTSGRTVTRTVRVLVACLSALLSLWLGPVTAAVAGDPPPSPLPTPSSTPSPSPTPTARDHLTLGTYLFPTDLPAAVVTGSSGNDLRVDLVAGRPLVDGTIVVRLPRREWPTDLHPGGPLYAGNPDFDGSFVVRPVDPPSPPGVGDCRGTDAAPITVTVVNTAREHVGVVQHLSCGLGDHISVWIVGLRAPRRLGVHAVGVSVSDASGQRGPRSFDLRVVKRPTTRLTVDVPMQVTLFAPTPVVVRALRPDGRVDTHARGWVSLTGPGGDECLFESGAPVRFELTAADAGVKVVDVRVQLIGTYRIVAESISHRQRPGESAGFVASGEQRPIICSVSYH